MIRRVRERSNYALVLTPRHWTHQERCCALVGQTTGSALRFWQSSACGKTRNRQEMPDVCAFTCYKETTSIHASTRPWESYSSSLSHFTATSIQKILLWTGVCFLIAILHFSHSIFSHNPVSAVTIIKATCWLQDTPIRVTQAKRGGTTGSQGYNSPCPQNPSSDKDQK